ncbi:MAG TPA: DUF1963 domain-containing protein [Vineibacter sp.]|nr:DUF1963 domain-containing protein [Vineibacter sp.]
MLRGAIRRIADRSLPALVLETTVTDEASISLGASKIGGLPDLPKDVAWPTRPPYDGAAALADAYRKEAADALADAGVIPPWLPAEEGRKYVEARRRQRAEAAKATREIMEKAGVDKGIDFDALTAPSSPEHAAKHSKERLAMADAVSSEFPLSFIGQFDLAALSKVRGFDRSLPDHGRLLLFHDYWHNPATFEPRSAVGIRLIWDQTPASSLARAALPAKLAEVAALSPWTVFKPAAVSARAVVTTIPAGDASWDALQIDKESASAYGDWLGSLGWPTDDSNRNHQLGGWPRAIQNGMQATSQLASNGIDAGRPEAYQSDAAKRLLVDAKDWKLVLQIGRDAAVGLDLPGAFYVLMREQDIRDRRFDRAWLIYEQD